MKRLGMPVSDDTILRASETAGRPSPREDDCTGGRHRRLELAKGPHLRTIIVDLERREVADVLQDRTTAGTAEWLRQHPEVEIVSRDQRVEPVARIER